MYMEDFKYEHHIGNKMFSIHLDREDVELVYEALSRHIKKRPEYKLEKAKIRLMKAQAMKQELDNYEQGKKLGICDE